MSAFQNDCGTGMPAEVRAKLEREIAGHLARLVANVGPCERCRAEYLGLWHEQLYRLSMMQPKAVKVAVADACDAAVERRKKDIQAFEAEAKRIADELLGGGR